MSDGEIKLKVDKIRHSLKEVSLIIKELEVEGCKFNLEINKNDADNSRTIDLHDMSTLYIYAKKESKF